ncbi:unnamed protein product [Rhizophagus irregularis]|nr:unnamed protein product [Rhizophagus irregularis]
MSYILLDQKLVTIQHFQPFQRFLILHLHLAPENLSSCQYPHSFVTCDCKIVIILQLSQKDPCIPDDHTIYQLLVGVLNDILMAKHQKKIVFQYQERYSSKTFKLYQRILQICYSEIDRRIYPMSPVLNYPVGQESQPSWAKYNNKLILHGLGFAASFLTFPKTDLYM